MAEEGKHTPNRRGERPVKTDDGVWLPVAQDEDNPAILTWNIVDEQRYGELTSIEFGQPDLKRKLKFQLSEVFSRTSDQLLATLAVERDRGGAFLWAPVLFGLGCICYFTLPREPLAWAFPLIALIAFAVAWKIGREFRAVSVLMGLALFAAGATAGQIRTQLIDTTMLSKTGIGEVTGRVMKAEYRASGSTRYTLHLGGPSGQLNLRGVEQVPNIVRLTARKNSPRAKVGALLAGKARLGPPPGPSYPGSYDFSFQSWFNGIGASGFFLGKPEVLVEPKPLIGGTSLAVARVRANISALIREALPGRNGGLAAALIVGDRSGIDDETAETLRRSGLAHILAISGLHMALVSATVIFALRALFALFPTVSLVYPTRKWACGAALVTATIYLILSGGSVSTQRAYIMIAIMLVAVLCDRRALTMRNVAIAAFIVLILAPEAILTPGFQMSFAAVAALVATYEVASRRREKQVKKAPEGMVGRAWMFLTRDLSGLALTSLVAGIATGLFAAYHFQRVAPFGLLANVLAMPLVTFAVMPLALLSVLAMPFALEAWPLAMMSKALEAVVSIAGWVAEIGPSGNTGYIPAGSLVLGALGLLVLTLSRTQLKLLSLPLFIVAFTVVFNRGSPDILVLESGLQIGVVNSTSELSLMRPNADKFSTGIWQKAFAPAQVQTAKVPRGATGQGFVCDAYGCSVTVKGAVVTQLRSTARLFEDCRLSDVIIVPFKLAKPCSWMPEEQRPMIIDQRTLRREGALSLTIAGKASAQTKPQITIQSAYQSNKRPWNRHRVAN